MLGFLKRNSIFLSLFALVFAALGIALLCTDKAQLHLQLNDCHTCGGDIFFRYYTLIAEYGIYIAAVALLFWRAGASIYLLGAEAVGAILVQTLKHIVRAPRPKVFFDLPNNPDILPIVDGVHLHSSNSFPSGHASTFFVLFFCLCVAVCYYRTTGRQTQPANNKKETLRYASLQVLCFLLALTGAYSRIYLSQHFAADIFAGGIIGTFAVIVLYPAFLWLNNRFPKVCAWHIALPKRRNRQDNSR